MKVKRKIIAIDEERCNGCGLCVLSCAEGAIKIVDGKARLISDQYCDGLGACLGECPQEALRIIEREADEFNEGAVAKHLQNSATYHDSAADLIPECPSAQSRILSRRSYQPSARAASSGAGTPSALVHWPVQINLVQPTASFLKNADLLVAADCTPVAYPDFHRDFINGKVVLIGCPKFDDTDRYKDKFARIFKTAGIKSLSVVVMGVPCCQKLPHLVKVTMLHSDREIPLEQITINAEGKIIERK